MKHSKLDISKHKGQVLEKILAWKRQEVPAQMEQVPLAQVTAFAQLAPVPLDFATAFVDGRIRFGQPVVQSLMISLPVVVEEILGDGPSE